MNKINKSRRFGGVHGLCILVKKNIAKHCTIISDTISDSTLWLLIDKHVLSFSFVIGGVYMPNESSIHYHNELFDNLTDDIITINSSHGVPIILFGDFNSRTGISIFHRI